MKTCPKCHKGADMSSRTLFSLLFYAVILFGLLFAMAHDVLVVGPGMDKEAAEIEGLPGSTLESFYLAPPDSRVAITATLTGNPILKDDLVAYVRQVWSVVYDGPDTWEQSQQFIPPLTLQLEGQTVHVLGDQSGNIEFGGRLHEYIHASDSKGPCANYGGQRLCSGSLRFRGLVNGDVVTVVGRRTPQGAIVPSRLYGGSRAELVSQLRRDAEFRRSTPGNMLVCPVTFLLAAVVIVVIIKVAAPAIRTRRAAHSALTEHDQAGESDNI
jgi:hypothetical protein